MIDRVIDIPVIGTVASRLVEMAAVAAAWLDAAGPEGIVALFWDGRDTTQLVVVAGMMVFLVLTAAMMAVVGERPAPQAGTAGRLARDAGSLLGGLFGSGTADRPATVREPEVPTLEPTLGQPPAPPASPPRPRPAIKAAPKSKAGTAKSKAAKPPANAPAKAAAKASAKATAKTPEKADELAGIEAEMMTLKELHARGHISADEYVTESRALYDRAKALN